LMGVITSLCFLGLFRVMPLAPGSKALLFVMLLVPTFAVTFADVVLDALIIETGQPRGITGRLQSVRWGAGYTATSLAGLVGGWLCQQRHEEWAFLICGALATVALAVLLLFVREPRAVAVEDDLPTIRATLLEAFRSPTIRYVGLFLFVWHFNPFTQSVLYLHVTEHIRLPPRLAEQFYGDTIFFLSAGSIVACISYGFYCRRISMRWMVPLSIATGVLSTLLYWFLRPEHTNAMTISVLVGFTYMTSNLVQCDLAARACPLHAAGTVFGVLMALCNVSTLLSTCVGGYVYEWFTDLWETDRGFQALLVVGALFTLASWPAARRIPHHLLPK
jgi:predicted MFS family arabinose efflux permease